MAIVAIATTGFLLALVACLFRSFFISVLDLVASIKKYRLIRTRRAKGWMYDDLFAALGLGCICMIILFVVLIGVFGHG